MLDNLLIHPRTKRLFKAALDNRYHGILLAGNMGAGKKYLGMNYAAEILGLKDLESLEKYPYYVCIDPLEASITIESIRAIRKLLTLKTPQDTNGINRVILIIDADRMKSEAQNALLKTLEEPPSDTCIILTSNSIKSLLPTITSRVQVIEVLPVAETHAVEYFKTSKPAELKGPVSLSRGNAALLNALVIGEDHELKDSVKEAKIILSASISERVAKVDALSKDKLAVQSICDALTRIAHAALLQASSLNRDKQAEKWHKTLKATQRATSALKQNANTKLTLDELFFNL